MKIQAKITSVIFTLILITGIVATTTTYFFSKQMIEHEIYHRLENSATSKALTVETLLDENVEFVKALAADFTFTDALNSKNLVITIQKIKDLVNWNDDISRIRILDKQGKVVASSHSKIDPIGNAEMFAYGKEDVYIRDIHISTMTGTKVISISAPILIKGEFAAIVIVNVEIEDDLYEILSRQYEKTDESYLINREGYMITASRFIEDSFLKLKVDSSEVRECLRLSEEKHAIEPDIYTDYRGEWVMGTHRVIKSMNWCLLVKMDAKEAFAPIYKLIRWMLLFLITLLGVGGIVAFFTSKNLVRSIKKLQRRAEEIAKGNWNYQVAIDSEDEIKQFSNAFDSMTTALQKAQYELQESQAELEIRVTERTFELSQEITEHERTEQILQKERDKLVNILNAMPSGVYIVNKDYEIEYVNPILEKEFGLIEGRKCFEYFYDLSDICQWCKNEEIFEGKTIKWEWYSSKIQKYYDVLDTPIQNADGSISKFEILHDITERKRAEKKLQESEQRFRAIFDQAPVGIALINSQTGQFLQVNKKYCDIVKYNQEEMLDMDFTKIMHPDDLQSDLDNMERMKKNEISFFKMDKRYFCKDGSLSWVNLTTVPLMRKRDKLEVHLAIAEDITERKQVEMALEKSEKRFRALFERFPIAYQSLDKNGGFLDVNPEMEKLLGYEKAELLGKPFGDFWTEETKTIFSNAFCQFKECGVVNNELHLKKKDGKEITILINGRIQYDSDGEYIRSHCTLHDITARKRMEEQLILAKKEADSANRMKSEFLANMSHEIRTPMNAVIGFSDLLLPLVKDKQQKNYLDSIRISGRALLSLINDILDLSKIEAGRLEIQYSSTNLHVLFLEIQQIFMMKADEKGLSFMQEIEKDLPTGLILDEIRLRQVIINLVSNAFKFTKQGHIKISAHKVFCQNHSKVDLIIAVEDTGIGIPENQQAKMFESFTQVEGQSTRQYGGTGLGLAISKRLVELMNGEITLRSAVGAGSLFEVTLKDVELSAIETREIQKQAINLENISFEKATILVVDDVESNRILIRECLNQVNLNIIEAQNGEESLLCAEESQPDLILMDLKMPIMDGYQATKQLKKNETTKNIPIVALTAFATSEEKQKIEASNFDSYLYKPVDISELLGELSLHIAHSIQIAEEEESDIESVEEAEISLTPEELAKLLKILEKEMLAESQELSRVLEIDGIEKFAKRAINLGKIYRVKLLLEYGQNLAEYTENFELDKVSKALKDFDKIIGEMKKLKIN